MNHELYMQRCIALAQKGAGRVAPNPMVGAVLVSQDRIIGEGWHEQYGQAHAEVNCINSVREEDKTLIRQSTLYVTLEPCAHFGKTPPCADLVIKHKIPTVVIGCRDPFIEVNGKGIDRLNAAGIHAVVDVLEKECRELNKRFFTFHTKQRPYIILKWAQTANGKMSGEGSERMLISNDISNRLVHRWRSEEASILVGTRTAFLDDPELTNRLWEGPSPVRMVVDKDLRLPSGLKLFSGQVPTIVFNTIKHQQEGNILYYQIGSDASLVHQILNALYHLNIQSVIVEGGAQLLQSFIDENMWDEIRKIENDQQYAGAGLHAPQLPPANKISDQMLDSDHIEIFQAISF